MSGPTPFGLRRLDGKLVPDPVEAAVVERIVRAFVRANGRIKAACTSLEADGVRTRRGARWSDAAVRRVLDNPALAKMIPEDLWKRCFKLIGKRVGGKPRRRSTHPLGGVVRCGCSERMYARGSGSKGKFVCRGCRAKISQDVLERAFVHGLESVVLPVSTVFGKKASDAVARVVPSQFPDGTVSLSSAWELMNRDDRSLLVDLVVDELVVEGDEIRVVLARSEPESAVSTAPDTNLSPSQHGSLTSRTNPTTSSAAQLETDELPPLLTVEEVAVLIRTTPKSVYTMIDRGQLPGVTRLGRRLRVHRDDLVRWLHESRASSPQERRSWQ